MLGVGRIADRGNQRSERVSNVRIFRTPQRPTVHAVKLHHHLFLASQWHR